VSEIPVDEERQHECPLCGAEAPYVLYDGDKMCGECGHVPGVGGDDKDAHESWREHRRENYSGWTGPDRIKFPGGFASAYDFGEDFTT
jgi:hypothetical protein